MKAIQLTETIHRYCVQHGQNIHPVLADLARETATIPMSQMQIAPDQGMLMHMLVRLTGARRILEVGCFTGYSAICMAAALPSDGQLLTMDVNPETTAIATRYFTAAGLQDRIKVELGPALDTLGRLKSTGDTGRWDMMFIDADKTGMPAYYEAGLELLRPGGLIIADNVLWSGSVIDPADQRPDTVAIRKFNTMVREDNRVEKVMLGIADGIYLIRKK